MGKSEGMWHEARKQERKIRVMMVDYKRRADRRRQFYERIKQDPTQFLRVYGRPCKIHWESSVALAAEGPQSMMAWQGDANINIDRFDARAHLDYYKDPPKQAEELTVEQQEEERNCNYERYRILVQNDCAGVPEDQCLQQIHIDELYGALETKNPEEEKKSMLAEKKAAIGYTYEDSTDRKEEKPSTEEPPDDESEESELEMDLDNTVDVYNLAGEQIDMLNQGALQYGMEGCDYYDNLQIDKDEAEALKMAKILEEEKAQFSGRRSRRERRAFKEKRMKDRTTSPPSYAARESPKYEPFKQGLSPVRSRSRSPDRPEQFSFISSFGGDGEEGVLHGPMLPPHLLPQSVRNKVALARLRKRSRSRSASPGRGGRLSSKAANRISHLKSLRGKSPASPTRSKSCSPSRSRSPQRRFRSRSRSRSRRFGRYSRSRSRSRSRRRYSRRSRSYSRSRSRSPRSRSRRSRSRRSRSYTRSRSRSRRSFSRSYSSRSSSYSHSRSRSRSGSASRSRSRSPSPGCQTPSVVKSYRRPSLSSKSSDSDDNAEERSNHSSSTRDSRMSLPGKLAGKKEFLSPKQRASAAEKMKLKMQKALKRQYRADMQARQEKEEKLTQERQDREDELRALSIQMRRRERERRHKDRDDPSDDEDDEDRKSRSRSPKSKSDEKKPEPRARSRDRSRSPCRDKNMDRDRRPSGRETEDRYRRPPPDNPGYSRYDDPRWSRDNRDSREGRYNRDWRDRNPRDMRDYRDSWNSRDGRDRGTSRDGRDQRDARDWKGGRDSRDAKRTSENYNRRRSPSPHSARQPKLVDY